MLARLIIDSEGPNPKFDPPDPRVDREAYVAYCRATPATRIVPAGTILEGPSVWMHCVPDAEGVIRAEPLCFECEAAIEAHEKRRSRAQAGKRSGLQDRIAALKAKAEAAARRN